MYIGYVKTCPDTYKSTPNILSKDILYKEEPDPNSDCQGKQNLKL